MNNGERGREGDGDDAHVAEKGAGLKFEVESGNGDVPLRYYLYCTTRQGRAEC